MSDTTTAPGGEAPHRLHWEPRRTLTLEAARKRSLRIKHLRRVMIVAALGLVAAVTAYLMRSALQTTPEPVVAEIADDAVETVQGVTFRGVDAEGRPYLVVAETATRDQADPDLNRLTRPTITFNTDELRGDGSAARIDAAQGVYNAEARFLELNREVVLQTPDGQTFASDHARFFLDNDKVEGDLPVTGETDFGRVEADSYMITEGGAKVVFVDGVKTRIFKRNRTGTAGGKP